MKLRKVVAAILVVLGVVLMVLAPETPRGIGIALIAIGIVIETVGIALERRR